MKTKSFEQFVEEARKIHGNRYIYHKDTYVNMTKPTTITCPIHGDFTQTPNNHLSGNGCPKCNQSKLENEIMQFLTEHNIEYIPQHSFKWLKYKGKMSLDFYLPKYNIAIECQGKQHFQIVEHFGGDKCFKDTIKRDNIKRALCESNGVKLLYYSNLGIEYPYEVYESKEELLKIILK